jgi:hypothetical protein
MRSNRTIFFCLVLVVPVLASCGGSNVPSCLLFTPEHNTIDGIAQVGQTMEGDQVDDVVLLGTNLVDAAPMEGLTVLYEVSCDDEACTPTVDCAPQVIDVGDAVSCSVLDEIAQGDCSWTCQVSVTATVLDSDVCRDTLAVIELAGEHIGAVPGR